MANNKISNIRSYRKSSFFNIGTMIFGIIFIYMIICIFLYMTAKHVTSYEVTSGSISGNYRYMALALKEEDVITAPQGGYVTYYAREGAKTAADNIVCAINETNDVSVQIASKEMTADENKQLRSSMKSFSINFKPSSFQTVYNFKANMEAFSLELRQDTDENATYILNKCTAPASGFVVYSIDGMETLTEEQLSMDDFSQKDYQEDNLRLNKSVRAGQNLYKLIGSENWSLYFPLDEKLALELQDKSTLRFRFLKDNCTFTADFSIVQNGNGMFGKLTLDNSLVRYVSDRFLDIELLIDRKTGLKIPTSSIAEREFYKIPEEYVITNKDTENEITVLRETFLKDGSSAVKYITANVYAKEKGFYLVSTELFKNGDYIQMVDTSKKFQIEDVNSEVIQGVYNINKGYARFREVTIIDENEEFCIVEADNVYSLAAHDHIVLDASTVEADDIVY